MKIIKPSYEILTCPLFILEMLEQYGRTCYKSEEKITEDSAKTFIQGIINRGHQSVIEHVSITVRIICDRGVSHEIVRHRLASYSQESTRYCNYSKEKFGNEITVIKPCFWEEGSELYNIWEKSCKNSELSYFMLLENGAQPQEARSVLPHSLKAEIIMTCNLREWIHFFKLRTSKAAHPQMREIAIPMLAEFQQRVPIIFDNNE